MEFSFEYTEFWKFINLKTGLTYSVAFGGVLLLYLPARLTTAILGRTSDGKSNLLVGMYLCSTWIIGAIVLAGLSFMHPQGISIFLIWMGIAVVNLFFITSNATFLVKIWKEELLKTKDA